MVQKHRFALLAGVPLLLAALLAACGGPVPQQSSSMPQASQTASGGNDAPSSSLSQSRPMTPSTAEEPAPEPSPDSSAPSQAASSAEEQQASQPSPTPVFNRKNAIGQGLVVLSGSSSVPCYNSDKLLDFYAEYQDGLDSSIDIYSFRSGRDNEVYYQVDRLTLRDGVAMMTEDTTNYYTLAEAAQNPGVTHLGSFTMRQNRYGHLVVDVTSEDNALQFNYLVTPYEELYPSIASLQEEYQRYLAPLLGTGILELNWDSAEFLLEKDVFPQAFESLAGEESAKYREVYYDKARRVYRYPQELVEEVLLRHFYLTADQLRTLPAHQEDAGVYEISGPPAGFSSLRILKATEFTFQDDPSLDQDESLLELRYEFYDPKNGAPVMRGKLSVLCTSEESFYYTGNVVLGDSATDDMGAF